jgi:NitT/TauT family transport system permease protein
MTVFGFRLPLMSSLLIWCVLWEIAGRAGLSFLLPPFTSVLGALGGLVESGKFQDAALMTLAALATGMAISIAIGIPLGILMGRVPLADRLLGMWVNVFVSAPLSALVPIIMLLFGFGQTTIVVTVVLFAVWIIALDTYAGVRHVSPSLVDMARSFGAGRWALYGKILIWAALPEILTGVRLGLIRAVKGVVIGQLLVSIIGMGRLLELYSRNFLMDDFWALILFLFIFAFALSEAIGYLERRVAYYAGTRG